MSDYQPRRPGSNPAPARRTDRAGKPALGRPKRGLIDESEARQLAEDRERMRRAGVGPDDIDVFAPHQANLRIIELMAKRLKLPERTVIARDIVRSGNTSSASVPLALSALLESGEAKSGDLALLLGEPAVVDRVLDAEAIDLPGDAAAAVVGLVQEVALEREQIRQRERERLATVCKHWLRGLCKKGDACEFLHEYNLRRMPECWWYAKYGYCSAGDECLYAHPKERRVECPDYNRGFCKLGASRFHAMSLHPPSSMPSVECVCCAL